ncbi:hypothetical protein DHD32_20305 [Arenibacter sp. TNZ]|nr:hypothetical protein [Arenibacter sp. TNZ]
MSIAIKSIPAGLKSHGHCNIWKVSLVNGIFCLIVDAVIYVQQKIILIFIKGLKNSLTFRLQQLILHFVAWVLRPKIFFKHKKYPPRFNSS